MIDHICGECSDFFLKLQEKKWMFALAFGSKNHTFLPLKDLF
jgi:hypothetical protein